MTSRWSKGRERDRGGVGEGRTRTEGTQRLTGGAQDREREGLSRGRTGSCQHQLALNRRPETEVWGEQLCSLWGTAAGGWCFSRLGTGLHPTADLGLVLTHDLSEVSRWHPSHHGGEWHACK